MLFHFYGGVMRQAVIFVVVFMATALISGACRDQITQPSSDQGEWVGLAHNKGVESVYVSLSTNSKKISAVADQAEAAFKYASGSIQNVNFAMSATANNLRSLYFRNRAEVEQLKRNNPLVHAADSILERKPTPDQFDAAINSIEQRVGSEENTAAKWCLKIVKYSYRYWTINGPKWKKLRYEVNVRNSIASPDTGGEEGGGWGGFALADFAGAIMGALECLPYLYGYPWCVAAYGIAGSIIYAIYYFYGP